MEERLVGAKEGNKWKGSDWELNKKWGNANSQKDFGMIGDCGN